MIEPNPTTIALPNEVVKVGSWKEDTTPAKERISPKGKKEALVTSVTFVLFGIGGAIAQLGFHRNVEWAMLMTLPSILATVFTLRHKETTPVDEMLKEDPDDDLAEIVQIGIVQNGVTTGTDQGLMSVLDNTIVFIGRRCSFAIGCQHLDRKRPRARGSDAEGSAGSTTIPLIHPEREISVHVSIVRGSFSQNIGESKLVTHLRNFIRHHKTPTKEVVAYPPLSIGPGALTPGPPVPPIAVAVAAILVCFILGLLLGNWPLFICLSILAVVAMPFYREPKGRQAARDLLAQLSEAPDEKPLSDSDQNRISTRSSLDT